jgi:mono/diheme cytochrome c family protein
MRFICDKRTQSPVNDLYPVRGTHPAGGRRFRELVDLGDTWFLKRLMSAAAACAIAALLVACAKSDDQSANATATGPVTDSSDSGLKPVAGVQSALGDPKHGSAIFSQNCSSCHGVAGAGGGIGPTLKGEKSRKDFGAAVAWIKNPKAPMPKLYPSPLSASDVADVASYVESL